MVLDGELSSASVSLAVALRDILQAQKLRIVLAESCTGGNVAAALARVPGISDWLCGSFVVYRNDSKASWLGINQAILADPQIGPVSRDVTELLAQAALARTPEADVAAAITGHLGPGALSEFDGKIFGAICLRKPSGVRCESHHLRSTSPVSLNDYHNRSCRLLEATNWMLNYIANSIVEQTKRQTKIPGLAGENCNAEKPV